LDQILIVVTGNVTLVVLLSVKFFFWGGGGVVVRDRVSLYSPGCPGTHFVDQTGLELRNLPASAAPVLGLKACATTPGFFLFKIEFMFNNYRHHAPPLSPAQVAAGVVQGLGYMPTTGRIIVPRVISKNKKGP
jgi:hypothetical protein